MRDRSVFSLTVLLVALVARALAADGGPQFNSPPEAILLDSGGSVSENSAGAYVATFHVEDPDVGDVLSLAVDDARFELLPAATGVWDLRLRTAELLDFEAEPGVPLTLTARDQAGGTLSKTEWILVNDAPEAPLAIVLQGRIIDRFVTAGGQLVGYLSARDPDTGDAHAFAVVGDDRFEVRNGNELWLLDTGLIGPVELAIDLAVSATDSSGLATSASSRLLAPPLVPINPAPTGIALDNSTVSEGQAGTVIGKVIIDDPGDTHSFLLSDCRFEVSGDLLRLRSDVSLDAEAEPSVLLYLAATDSGGSSIEAPFPISVENVNEPPTRVWLLDPNVDSLVPGDVVSQIGGLDPDVGDSVTYSVGGGEARFEVIGSTLKLLDSVAVDRRLEPSIPITITATDGGALGLSRTFVLGVRGAASHSVPASTLSIVVLVVALAALGAATLRGGIIGT